jgi:hypothetical protein
MTDAGLNEYALGAIFVIVVLFAIVKELRRSSNEDDRRGSM